MTHQQTFVWAAQLPDPAQRAAEATKQLEAIERAQADWVALRDSAIMQMKSGSTYRDVAERLGLSRPRIQQICKRAEGGHLFGR